MKLAVFVVLAALFAAGAVEAQQVLTEGTLTTGSVSDGYVTYFTIPSSSLYSSTTYVEVKVLRQTSFTESDSALGICKVNSYSTTCTPYYTAGTYSSTVYISSGVDNTTIGVGFDAGTGETATTMSFKVTFCQDECDTTYCDYECWGQGVCDTSSGDCTCDSYLEDEEGKVNDYCLVIPAGLSQLLTIIIVVCVVLPILIIVIVVLVCCCCIAGTAAVAAGAVGGTAAAVTTPTPQTTVYAQQQPAYGAQPQQPYGAQPQQPYGAQPYGYGAPAAYPTTMGESSEIRSGGAYPGV